MHPSLITNDVFPNYPWSPSKSWKEISIDGAFVLQSITLGLKVGLLLFDYKDFITPMFITPLCFSSGNSHLYYDITHAHNIKDVIACKRNVAMMLITLCLKLSQCFISARFMPVTIYL